MILLPAVVDALVVVEAVQRAKDLVAQIADGVVEWLEVLLLFVPLQRQLGAEQFAAHVTSVAGVQWQRQQQPAATANHVTTARRGEYACRGAGRAASGGRRRERGATVVQEVVVLQWRAGARQVMVVGGRRS